MIKPTTDVDLNFGICAGGGFGVMVLACKNVGDGYAKVGIEVAAEIGGNIQNNNGLSNEFSTTWSYSTSDGPERPGAMSDVFVVPNLNVAYETWVKVDWDKDACKVTEVVTD